jgi:hypothetical protein
MSDTIPQFGTAEYESKPGTETCKSCKQPLGSSYYRINGMPACERCTNQLQTQLPKDSHSAFVRGLIFGIGGAVLGLIVYAAFDILTGWMIGYVALAVGYIVGKAMKLGSGGIGGRRYQFAAVALTYAAVSLAAIPITMWYGIKEQKTKPPAQAEQSAPEASEQPAASAGDSSARSGANPSERPLNLGAFLGMLTLVGLASPFLALQDPIHGLIGLVILSVGIRIAWQLTAGPKLDILGPFRGGVSVAAPPAL